LDFRPEISIASGAQGGPLSHPQQLAKDSERPAAELAERSCEEMVENLRKNVEERQAALAKLAAYDQGIEI
jgi:hypothetical protein